MKVNWPAKYDDLVYKMRIHAEKILTGTLIALDPSSGSKGSMPGFAIFVAGELLTSGEIDLPYKRPVYERLQLLSERVSKLTPAPPDVFVIEEIRGQGFSHHYLHWSIGTAIAAARTQVILENPINHWRALAKAMPGYVKGNAMDAELIGQSIIMRTMELGNGNTSALSKAPDSAS